MFSEGCPGANLREVYGLRGCKGVCGVDGFGLELSLEGWEKLAFWAKPVWKNPCQGAVAPLVALQL